MAAGTSTPSISSIDKEKYPDEVAVFPGVSDEALRETEVGYDIYKESAEKGLEWTEQEERWVLRRIDWRILPCFCISQGLSMVDKTSLNYGNLFGMKA